MTVNTTFTRFVAWIVLAMCLANGCDRSSKSSTQPAPTASNAGGGEVVIYSSLDEPYLRPVLKRFEDKTGISVRLVTDGESTKTAALVARIEAEKSHPQADVYWGNEIFHTIKLAEAGVFAPYRPATAEDVPARWRGAGDLYTDIGLRARLIAISTRPQFKELVSRIHGLNDLTDPALKGKIAICHPGFGTASGHVAALYVRWGEAKFTAYMTALRTNEIKLLGGNSAVAEQVAAGSIAAGPTDNDDVNNGKAEGQAIDGVIPDQGSSGDGTLLIPSTIALVAAAPHSDNAKKLIDFLCDPAIEKELIENRYFAYSVRSAGQVKAMDVDYVQCAHQMRRAVEKSLTILQSR